jgi:hypothetical protein
VNDRLPVVVNAEAGAAAAWASPDAAMRVREEVRRRECFIATPLLLALCQVTDFHPAAIKKVFFEQIFFLILFKKWQGC